MKANRFSDLLKEYIHGNQNAVTEIYNEYFSKLVGAAFMILHTKDLSENVANDVFVKLLENPEKFLNLTDPSCYLFVAAQNCAKNLLRRGYNSFLPQELTITDFSETANSEMDFYLLIRKYFSAEEQEIIILRCVWDYTYNQIAMKLKIPLGTIKTKFRQFKRRLKGVI